MDLETSLRIDNHAQILMTGLKTTTHLLTVLSKLLGKHQIVSKPLRAVSNNHIYSYVVPIIAYGFVGVEMIAITAFEARDLRSLRIPSQAIAYFVVGIYLLLAIGEFLNVEWVGTPLPEIYGINGTSVETSRSNAVFVIAAAAAGYKRMPGLLNGFMIFSALSASNSSLYVASRALYGMTRTISPWGWASFLKKLGRVWYKTGVPMWALSASFIAFLWLPFLQLKRGYAIADVSYLQWCG